MDRKVLARAVMLSTASLLVACSEPVNKIGATIKGERLAVLAPEPKVEADASLVGRVSSLPRSIVNLSWPQVGYDSEHAMPMVDFAEKPKILWKSR